MTLFQQRIGLVVSVCVFMMFGSSAVADVIFVPNDYPNIQAAIDVAQDGDIVVLEDGVYRGPGNRDIRLHGKAITVQSAFGATNCIIDAQGTSEEPYRGFIFDSGETTDTVLDGLTICGGATLPGAIADQFNGGGLFFVESSATIKNCVINDNACGCWGAGVYCNFDSSPILINCDISNNHAGDDGGGIFTWNEGSATLINCNLNDNSAVVTGGAVSGFGGGDGVSLINCCLANNEAPFGSAVLGWDVTIANSIIWGDAAGELVYQNSATINYSTVQGGYPGVGNIDRDPMFVDAVGGDYHLLSGSPCIDAADNTIVPGWVTSDADGQMRFVDDPNSIDTGNGLGPIIDMGAFEFQLVTTVVSPESLTVDRGNQTGGTLADTVESDDSYVSFQPGLTLNAMEAPVRLIFDGSLPSDSPNTLDLVLESSAVTAGMFSTTLEAWNWNTNSYDVVDVSNASVGSDTVTTVDLTSGISDYVQSGTGAVRSRVGWRLTGFAAQFPWEVQLDQLVWKVIQ